MVETGALVDRFPKRKKGSLRNLALEKNELGPHMSGFLNLHFRSGSQGC